ncbi:MAG TPA: hypothetical protein VKB18_06540 [Gemmatimonadota bacterium]|nr:hypothetical protein [Gemmatimonadota bacterium]
MPSPTEPTDPIEAPTTRRPPGRGRPPAALTGALALALAVAAGPLRAQQGSPAPAAGTAPADTAGPAEPEIAPAPLQFRLGLSAGALMWDQSRSRVPGDDAAWGIDVGRQLLRYLSVRLGVAYLPTRVEDPAGATDVHGYLLEVAAEPRLALPSLERIGVVPFATVGAGTLVFDPRQPDLPTRSQNAFEVGGGLEGRIAPRFGARAELRAYTASLQSLFEPTDRTGATRHAQRLMVSLYWTF